MIYVGRNDGKPINCARRALVDDERWFYVAGGTVANAYGYRSYQTVCVAAVNKE